MWKWLAFVIFLAIACAVSGEDYSEEDSLEARSEIDRENWRALTMFEDDETVWIPRERKPAPSEGHKRRRLRMRKRRPTPASIIEEMTSAEVFTDISRPAPRRILPQRLEDDPQLWREVAEDSVRKPNIRRRVTPGYQPSEEVTEPIVTNPLEASIYFEDESSETDRDVAKSAEEVVDELIRKPGEQSSVSDLKAVLKQYGTDSLSEILQKKNLSLSELLMGNQKAISALTEMPQESTPPSVSEATKYKRLPPVVGMRKAINRNFEQGKDSAEALSNKEMLEAQRKRLSLLSHKDNKLFSTVTKYDVVTEPTTERRIFVPSHSKYYTSPVFRPNINVDNAQPTKSIPEVNREESTTSSTTTTTTSTPTTERTTTVIYVKPKVKNLPITNAKMNKLPTKFNFKAEEIKEEEEEVKNEEQVKREHIEEIEEKENYPILFNFPKPIPISIQEVSGFMPKGNRLEHKERDEPVKMTLDLDVSEKTTEKTAPPSTSTESISVSTTTESTTTEELSAEKIVQATAKDEIMEVLKDPISRERLARILENRNMTVKELVEQRERGSSQLHLADIFHNKTREPEPKGEPFIGTVNSEYFNSFPLFGRQQKSRQFENEQPIATPKPSLPTTTEPATSKPTEAPQHVFSVTTFPAVKIGTDDDSKKLPPFLWKVLETDLLSRLSENDNKIKSNYYNDLLDDDEDNSEKNYSSEQLQRLEEIDSTLSLASNEQLNVEQSIHQDEEPLINIPSGVKSAIFVSLAIICLSIVVFLTILLVFKWTQRQKKKINYCNSLSTKIKSPMIIQGRPTRAIKSFMTETLGRKKNYYKSNVHSSEDLWACGRERIPSF